jgi:CRP-like cAMP-binding protein
MEWEPLSFLGSLAPADAEALLFSGMRRRFPRGAVLFGEGDRSDRVIAVLSGRVEVSTFTADGREVLLGVREHLPADICRELAAVRAARQKAGEAQTEAVRVALGFG